MNVAGLAGFLAGVTLCSSLACGESEGDARPPNVILISVDTLRRDHVGSYGYERDVTPHLDAFFEKGTTFLNATSPAPCTVPAVQQMLTGILDYGKSQPRLAERLRARGYATAAIVSQQHFRDEQGPRAVYRRGFEHFDVQSTDEVDRHGMTTRTATQVSDRTIAWLESRNDDRPIFLWLHYFDPHDPYEAPELHRQFPRPAAALDGDRRRHLSTAMRKAMKSAGPSRRAEILEKPNPYAHFGAIYTDAQIATLQSLYDAEILYSDAEIQRVLDTLAELGELERSLVLFTSDHGERLGEADRWAHCQSVHAYEINVPLLLRLPGQSEGERVDRPASTLDVVPTVLRAAGIAFDPADFDGWDLTTLPDDRVIYSIWRRERAVQNQTWKLAARIAQGTEQLALYDLVADPDESIDVSEQHPEQAALLAEALREAAKNDAALLLKIEETLEQLRAIGYVQ